MSFVAGRRSVHDGEAKGLTMTPAARYTSVYAAAHHPAPRSGLSGD